MSEVAFLPRASCSTMADAFQPVPSLWSLILDHVDASEVEEIKERLGESLVDETIDLRAEVNETRSKKTPICTRWH